MRVWKGNGVLHAHPRPVPPQDEELDIPESDVRRYAAAGNLFICACLEKKLAGWEGNPDG